MNPLMMYAVVVQLHLEDLQREAATQRLAQTHRKRKDRHPSAPLRNRRRVLAH